METNTEGQLNTGLLMMRLGLSATFMFYAVPRLMDGAGVWIKDQGSGQGMQRRKSAAYR
jgi:hypothetical protein